MKETFEWDQYIQEALEGANDPEGIDHLCRIIYFRLTRPKFRQSGPQAAVFMRFRMAAAKVERENGLAPGSVIAATKDMLKRQG